MWGPSQSDAPMCHGALRIEARSFLERTDCASVIETMQQRQTLVEVTLRFCVFCRDLTRVRAKSVVKRLGRIGACTNDNYEKGAHDCPRGRFHQ